MKFAVYIALIGAASAAACTNTETVAAIKIKSDAKIAYDAAVAKKTADVTAYEAKIDPLMKHIVEMTDALKALLKTRTYTTAQKIEAETNLGAAVKARDTAMAATGATAAHQILVNIDTAKLRNDEAIETELRALAACVPAVVTAYINARKVEQQTKKGYFTFTTEKKAIWDKAAAARTAKLLEQDATARYHSKYSAMTDTEKDMYDKIIIAQMKGRAAQIDEMDALMEKAKTREGYASLSDADKKKFKNGYNMMFDDDDKRKFQYRMDDDDARTKAGYFKMDQRKKDVFDNLRTKLNSSRDDSDKKFMDAVQLKKKAANFDMMSPDKQKTFMKGVMVARDKLTSVRDSSRRSDDSARASSGYYGQDETTRKNFDMKRAAQNKANAALGGQKSQYINQNMSYNQTGKMSDSITDKQKYMMMQLIQSKMNGSSQNGNMSNMQDKSNMSKDEWMKQQKSQYMQGKGNMQNNSSMSSMMQKGDGSSGSPCGKGQQGGMSGSNGRGPPGQQGGQAGQQGPRRILQSKTKELLSNAFGGGDSRGDGRGDGCQKDLCCGTVSGFSGKSICAPKWGKSYKGQRFSCIDSAQNLVVSAMALATATYMMI